MLAIDIGGGADGASRRVGSVRGLQQRHRRRRRASAEAEASGSGGVARGRIVSVEARPHPRGGATPPPSPPSPPAEAEHAPRAPPPPPPAPHAPTSSALGSPRREPEGSPSSPRSAPRRRNVSSQPGPGAPVDGRADSAAARSCWGVAGGGVSGGAPRRTGGREARREGRAARLSRWETSLNQAGPPAARCRRRPAAEETSRRKFPIDLSTATKVAIATISSAADRPNEVRVRVGACDGGLGQVHLRRLPTRRPRGETDARGVSVVVERRPSQLASDSVSGSKRGIGRR